MTIEEFAKWLRKEIEKRDWSQSDLARHSGVSTAQITRILSGERGLGPDSLNAIAKALKLPPETVFRAAGVLPPKSESDELIEKIMHIFENLPPEEQDNVIEYARMRRRLAEEKGKFEAGRKPKPRPASG